MNRQHLLLYTSALALLGSCFAGAQTPTQSTSSQKNQQNAKQQSTSAQKQNHVQSEGERVFAQNCARCHTPPDGFSPRISGTIALHMRVRASLSEHDMQELMRFFNP